MEAAPLADYPAASVAIARYRLEVIHPLLALPPGNWTENAIRARVAEVRQWPTTSSKGSLQTYEAINKHIELTPHHLPPQEL